MDNEFTAYHVPLFRFYTQCKKRTQNGCEHDAQKESPFFPKFAFLTHSLGYYEGAGIPDYENDKEDQFLHISRNK